jgi:hypothetical protein
MDTPNKFYAHPVTMKKVYVDTKPQRHSKLSMSPHPGMIGFFHSMEEAKKWLKDKGYQYITLEEVLANINNYQG